MNRARDPYNILGVASTASVDEIKRAYRRAVRAWHPDVSSAPDACERLRDAQWAYDRIRGTEARCDCGQARERTEAEPRPAAERYHRVARGKPPGTGPAHVRGAGTRDLFVELSLTADEVDRGVIVPLEIPWREACERCGSTGVEGWRPCSACGGEGARSRPRVFEVRVPAGARDGLRTAVWLGPGECRLHVVIRRS